MKHFDLNSYLQKMKIIINTILSRPEKNTLTYDILDTKKSIKNKMIALEEKHRQMKIGDIWQEVLGNYDGFENLGYKHKTGLDILSRSRKIIIELKNRTNTDNASSRKANFDKLVNFKKRHPKYTCIYGTINDTTKQKTNDGYIKIIIHDGVEIKQYTGMELLKLILGDDTDVIITFIKNTIDEFIQ